ncbi:MAG: M15 family metallopeptidase [Patescibacteria group bacterium]
MKNEVSPALNDEEFRKLQQEYSQRSERFDVELLKIPILESGEKLIVLTELSEKSTGSIIIGDIENTLIRETLGTAMMYAAEHFNEQGLVLKVESAYRSLDEQRRRFIKRYQSMEANFPDKTEAELLTLANTYTAGIPILAAHTAGAAVDVTLLDKNGQLLDFGVPYNYGDIESITDFPHLSDEVKQNRKILKNGMEKFGFVNYPFEYWHYSIGDVCAAHLTGQKYAKFGPVNYNPESNKTSFPKITNAFYTFFKT